MKNRPVYAYLESPVPWTDIRRYRPSAGMSYDKHGWAIESASTGNKSRMPLFERVAAIGLRPQVGGRLPVISEANASDLPAVERTVIWRENGLTGWLAQWLGDSALLWCPNFDSGTHGFFHNQPVRLSNELWQVSADNAEALLQVLQYEHRAYLCPVNIDPKTRLTLRRVLRGHSALLVSEFAALLATLPWIVTGLASECCESTALTVFAQSSVQQQLLARSGAYTIEWLDSPNAIADVLRPRMHLPTLDEVTLDAGERVKLTGLNIEYIGPIETSAIDVDLDDSGIADLSELQSQSRLKKVSIRGLLPASLSPVRQVASLRASFLSPERLSELSQFPALEELDIEVAGPVDLGILAGCRGLRRLCVRSTDGLSLRGLASLPSLESLELRVNEMPEDIVVLGELLQIRRLCIHAASSLRVGTIPALPSIEELELSGLEGRSIQVELPSLARWTSLQSISLVATNVSHLRWITDLSLRTLNLQATDIHDLGPLRSQTNLKALNIDSIPAKDLDVLGALGTLQILDVKHVDTELGPIFALENLQRLRLSNTRFAHCGLIRRMYALRELELDYTLVTDLAGLEQLPLEVLNLQGTGVHLLEPVSTAPLRKLNMAHTDIESLPAIPSLVTLEAGGSGLRTFGTIHVMQLHELGLSGVEVGDLQYLEGQKHLRRLDLTSARVNELSPSSLSGLIQLDEIGLSGAEVPGLEPLADLPRLRRLDLSSPPSAFTPALLAKLPPLAELRLPASVARNLPIDVRLRHHIITWGE